MKNRYILLLTLLFFWAAALSVRAQDAASQSFSVQVEQKDNLRLVISCQKQAGQKLALVIKKIDVQLFKSPYEEVIYEENIPASVAEHVRMLNLSQLGEGTYQIEVKGGKQRFAQAVRIETQYFQQPHAQQMELVVK